MEVKNDEEIDFEESKGLISSEEKIFPPAGKEKRNRNFIILWIGLAFLLMLVFVFWGIKLTVKGKVNVVSGNEDAKVAMSEDEQQLLESLKKVPTNKRLMYEMESREMQEKNYFAFRIKNWQDNLKVL